MSRAAVRKVTARGAQQWFAWSWTAAVFVAVGLVLNARWADVQPALAGLHVGRLVAAALLVIVGVGCSANIWRAVLAGLGATPTWRAGARIFFVGQLGKYLPGSVWPVLAQAQMGRALGIPRAISAVAAMLFLWVHVLSAVMVAALALPLSGALPLWLLLVFAPALLLLWPRFLGVVINQLLRLLRRPTLTTLPGTAALLRASIWAALMWGCYGAQLLLLQPAGALDFARAVGIFAAAWVAGFVVLFSPAGAGAREAVMVALLVPVVGTGPALAATLVSRALLTAADALWGLGFLFTGGERITVQATPDDLTAQPPRPSEQDE